MHESVLNFGQSALTPEMITGKNVLEVGSLNVNGSLRAYIEGHNPASYRGIDIQAGPGVDLVVAPDAAMGDREFDLIVSTEMLEHAPDWRAAIRSMKAALKPGGWLLITTRSVGFPWHEYPGDHWRFSTQDMRRIFADSYVRQCSDDRQAPGVFVLVRKPHGYEIPVDLNAIEVHAMQAPETPKRPLFSVIHPSARPDKWREVYDEWAAAANSQDFEYILVCDKRWGFTELPVSDNVRAVWNTGRRCYVDAVNIGAQYATGSVIVVNADDQFPCEDWDFQLAAALADSGKEVVEVSTGTPQEHERGILVLPILTRARFERLGYVLYPGYESMFADNDFCEMARRDDQVADARHLMFPHKHPFFDTSVPNDLAYSAQNRPEAYQLGGAVLAARRQANFGNPKKKRVVICLPGERFSSSWVSHMLLTMSWLQNNFDIEVQMAYSSNVYVTRHSLALSALKVEADYVLWIDDDNLIDIAHVAQLIEDLDKIPELDVVAGWCYCQSDSIELPVAKTSVGFFEGGESVSLRGAQLTGATVLIKIDWTGFPIVLMRQSALRKLDKPFVPLLNPDNFYGFDSEDISFSRRLKEAGLNMAVDPRVKVPHLKLRDADTTPAMTGLLKGEN